MTAPTLALFAISAAGIALLIGLTRPRAKDRPAPPPNQEPRP